VYQGTILFVSHDQDFVNKLATDIVELSANGAREYPGNYELYLYQKQQEELLRIDQKEKYQNNSTQKKQEKNIKQTDIKTTVSDVKTLEKTIAKLEKEIATIEQKFEHLQFGTEDFAVAEKKLTRLKHDLRNAMQQWEIYHA
jgi:ATP-binding cassette subfamily F protein 3